MQSGILEVKEYFNPENLGAHWSSQVLFPFLSVRLAPVNFLMTSPPHTWSLCFLLLWSYLCTGTIGEFSYDSTHHALLTGKKERLCFIYVVIRREWETTVCEMTSSWGTALLSTYCQGPMAKPAFFHCSFFLRPFILNRIPGRRVMPERMCFCLFSTYYFHSGRWISILCRKLHSF